MKSQYMMAIVAICTGMSCASEDPGEPITWTRVAFEGDIHDLLPDRGGAWVASGSEIVHISTEGAVTDRIDAERDVHLLFGDGEGGLRASLGDENALFVWDEEGNRTPLGLSGANTLAFLPGRGVAAAGQGVYLLENGAETWHTLLENLNIGPRGLLKSPDGGLLAAAKDEREALHVFRLPAQRRSFEKVAHYTHGTGVLATGGNRGMMVMACEARICQSRDGGRTWDAWADVDSRALEVYEDGDVFALDARNTLYRVREPEWPKEVLRRGVLLMRMDPDAGRLWVLDDAGLLFADF